MAVLCQNPWRRSADLSYKEVNSLHWSFYYLPAFQWTNHLNLSLRGVNFYSCIEEIPYLLSSIGGEKKKKDSIIKKQKRYTEQCMVQERSSFEKGLLLVIEMVSRTTGSPEIISPNENFNLSAGNIIGHLKVPTTTMGRERKHQVCGIKAKMNITWHIKTGL